MQTTRGTSLSPTDEHSATDQDSAKDRDSGKREHKGEQLTNSSGRRRYIGVLVGVAVVVLVLDVVSKLLVVAKLSNRAPVRLLGGFLKLEETRNAGAAFSIGTGATVLFALVAIGVIVVIIRSARKLYSRPWAIVLGLLLGGATGNLIDRLVRAPGVFRGEVVDWIRLPHFAVFNLADSAITIGGVLAVLLALRGHQIDGSIVSGHRESDEQRSPADPQVDDPVDNRLP